jgi:hypothetical protein
MGMKPPMNEAPLTIKGEATCHHPRDHRAHSKGSATVAKDTPNKPIKGSVMKG